MVVYRFFFYQKQVENKFLKCKNHRPVFLDTMMARFLESQMTPYL